jgi:glycosyltransferase involved in cell wall biosynthesis
MRIVDVNPFFLPMAGGIERRMHLVARELVGRGHEVTVLTGRLPGTEAEELTPHGYRVVRLPSRLMEFYNPPYISSSGVLEALEALDADVVNFNYRWAPSYTRDLGRYTGRKVFTYHNMWGEGTGIQRPLSELNDRLFRRHLDGYDHIIGVSDRVRDDLVRRGIPAGKVTVARPCLDCLPEMREEGDFILSLGRLVQTKGLDRLVEAMDGIDCRLVICGRGPEEGRLRRQIRSLGLEHRIEMRGWVSEEEKHRLMGGCRMFVMPSRRESYGLAALEAMSYGRPVVCTDADGLPDTVGPGGVVVPSGDPQALAGAINGLLDDPQARRRIGSAARAVAGSQTASGTARILEDVYRRVADGDHLGMY